MVITIRNLFLVDCQWGNWTETKCDATCGKAFRTQKRKILRKSAYGGQECTGDFTITTDCELKPCPGTT